MDIRANWTSWLLWGAVLLFLVTRIGTLRAMPIFNDESIYLQYSQFIDEDFAEHKYISVKGIFGDWKPPLQYWLGSLVVTHGDPLISGRLLALGYSLLGLLGIYLFAKELFGKETAAIAVFLWALCPPIILYNIQFIAETFLFSTAPWLYWLVLKATAEEKIRLQYLLLALIPALLLLLFKQSGTVLLLLALALPFTHIPKRMEKFRRRDESGKRERVEEERIAWGSLSLRALLVLLAAFVAMLLMRTIIPTEFNEIRSNFDSRWLFSVKEILHFPWTVWFANLKFVAAYYYKYYSIFLIPILLYATAIAVWKKNLKVLAPLLMFIGASSAILLLLKGFNEYIYNTSAIVFIVLLTAYAVHRLFSIPGRNYIKIAGIVLTALLLLHWSYQAVLMAAAPGKYFERSTNWARVNYLEGISSGFGVEALLDYINKQEGTVVIFGDPQWGNPRTAIEVYKKQNQSPRAVILHITSDFHTEKDTIEVLKWVKSDPNAKTRLAIYSSISEGGTRSTWQPLIQKYMCDEKMEIKGYPTQAPLIICRF